MGAGGSRAWSRRETLNGSRRHKIGAWREIVIKMTGGWYRGFWE